MDALQVPELRLIVFEADRPKSQPNELVDQRAQGHRDIPQANVYRALCHNDSCSSGHQRCQELYHLFPGGLKERLCPPGGAHCAPF